MAQLYKAPNATPSTIGPQFNVSYWDRRSITDAAEKRFFSPLADMRSIPKHMGKELKVFQYVPLLDVRNVNDQGLDAAGAVITDGNLYGSSKDIGTITSLMPVLGEEGGRVNRVGFTRLERSGKLREYGIFTEYTEDSLIFDTDSELYSHISRELVGGATEISEDLLQIDLINAAGTTIYAGTATSDATITGEGTDISVVTYADLKMLSLTLNDNRAPTSTKIIKGSRMIDTKTLNRARIMFIGSDLESVVENMVDGLGNPAYTPVRQYADAGTLLNGEIGSVGEFRMIVVPNMMRLEGAGGAVGTNPGYSETGGNYDVFPMLVVSSESFATIGLQASGKKQKFKIIVRKPGESQATTADPYGKTGFSSIMFYHGFISLRPEWIGLIKTVAPQ